jgi:hypothetical protein
MSGVLRLPKVPASQGTSDVSASTTLMVASGVGSSSAIACVIDVRTFWPTSVFPLYTVTVPSAAMCSQAASSGGRRLPPRPPRPAPPDSA